MMTFADYDKAAEIFAVYPGSGTSNLTAVIYTALGLTGEAGEFADKIKKIMRDSQMTITEERRTSLITELGDVLWYLSRAAQELLSAQMLQKSPPTNKASDDGLP